MASIDSGVDTGNESNDSSFTSDSKTNGETTPTSRAPPSPQPPKKPLFFLTPVEHFHTVFEPLWLHQSCALEASSRFAFPNLCAVHENSYSYYGYPAEEHRNKISLRHVCKKRYQILRFHSSKYHEIAHIKEILAEKRLRMAASLNHVETVKRLLGAGVNPKSADEKKRTALHIAACKGYHEIVGLLLAGGADPNQKDIVGNTALHIAAYTNHFKVILQLLRAAVVNLNKMDESGCTLLRVAQSRLTNLLKDVGEIDKENSIKSDIEESLKILEIILKYFNEKAEADLINGFSSQLSLKQAKEEAENTIQDVLSSLSELTLQKKK